MREVIKNDKFKIILLTMSIKKKTTKNTVSNLGTTFCIKNADVFKMSSLATVAFHVIFC
jgi:hypothetical protein